MVILFNGFQADIIFNQPLFYTTAHYVPVTSSPRVSQCPCDIQSLIYVYKLCRVCYSFFQMIEQLHPGYNFTKNIKGIVVPGEFREKTIQFSKLTITSRRQTVLKKLQQLNQKNVKAMRSRLLGSNPSSQCPSSTTLLVTLSH